MVNEAHRNPADPGAVKVAADDDSWQAHPEPASQRGHLGLTLHSSQILAHMEECSIHR